MRRSWLRQFLAGVLFVGAIAVYLASSGLGARLLHQEIETQLSRLLSGPVKIAEVELRFSGGLLLVARGLEAYPSPDPAGQPALRAARVSAWIDLLALLVGRLELSTLILDGPHLRIEQTADGVFVGLPLPPNRPGSDTKDPVSSAERLVRQMEWLNPAVAAFGKRFRTADRIEILDGTVSWIDHGRLGKDGTPQELRLELVSGIAKRDWLSGAIAIEWRAVFVDGKHTPFPIEFEMHSHESPHFEWTTSLSQIPLAISKTVFSQIEVIDGLTGTLDARIHFMTSKAAEPTLTLDLSIEDASIFRHRSQSRIEIGKINLRAELSLDDERLHLSEGQLSNERLRIEFKGAIDRPIDRDALAHLEARLIGAHVDGIRDLALRFKTESETALLIWILTERIESGHIRYLRAAGTASFQHWRNLATGRTREPPDDFQLGAAVEGIVVKTGSIDSIEDLRGEFVWVEDQISLRDMSVVYRGRQLPELNAVIDGISHLIRAADSSPTVTRNPPAIPGVAPLLEIFKPRDPNALPAVKAIGLAIDRLEHPLLRWPLRDLRLLIEPLRHGMQLEIREGFWGTTTVAGDVIWFNDPTSPSIRARLVVGPPPNPEQTVVDTDDGWSDPDRWGSGRFEFEFRPRPHLPFQSAVGFFRLDGANLVGKEVEVEFVPRGQAALRFDVDLQDSESVGLDLSFAITEATFEGINAFIALPPELISGDVGATGSLAGLVRPNTVFIAELDGRIRVEAEDGHIETSLPLLLRLGKASEGYNPFANEDELRYDSMTGTIELEHGVLTIEDFEIAGPLSVFANARLDTNQRPGEIKAVVGIFMFHTSGQLLDNLPLVRSFLPGSKRGLIGAYFEVEGPVNEPKVEALPLQTLMSSVPNAIKAPFKVLRLLFGRGENDS